ncbi:MAG: twin-arginine translocase TatA/TatE family subunit [Bacteroidota bacterium]
MATSIWFLSLGGSEIFVILGIVLLLFGGKKIPELMRGVGKGIREFNNAKATVESELKEGIRQAELEEKRKKAAAKTEQQA